MKFGMPQAFGFIDGTLFPYLNLKNLPKTSLIKKVFIAVCVCRDMFMDIDSDALDPFMRQKYLGILSSIQKRKWLIVNHQ